MILTVDLNQRSLHQDYKMNVKTNLPEYLNSQIDVVIETEGERLREHNLSFKHRYSRFSVNKILDGAAEKNLREMTVFGMMLGMGTYVDKNQELGVTLLKFLSEKSNYAAYQLSFVYFSMNDKESELEIIDHLVRSEYSPAIRRKANLASKLHTEEFNKDVYLSFLGESARQGNLRAKMTILMFQLKHGDFTKKMMSVFNLPFVYIHFMIVLIQNNQDQRLI